MVETNRDRRFKFGMQLHVVSSRALYKNLAAELAIHMVKFFTKR